MPGYATKVSAKPLVRLKIVETSEDNAAVDAFWFLKGNFIPYKGIRIDANTTMKDIQQLFPTAISGRLGMDKEGKLWVIKLREDYEQLFHPFLFICFYPIAPF